MTDFASSESEILAYVYGELAPDARRAFEEKMAAEPALRAEVDGLQATRNWLGADARFGTESGQDLPPPHLVDAIVQAEAIARSTIVREALQAPSPLPGGPGWLHRLNQWWLGGGVAVAATLALWVSSRSPEPEAWVSAEATLLAEKDAAEPAGAAQAAMAPPPAAGAIAAQMEQTRERAPVAAPAVPAGGAPSAFSEQQRDKALASKQKRVSIARSEAPAAVAAKEMAAELPAAEADFAARVDGNSILATKEHADAESEPELQPQPLSGAAFAVASDASPQDRPAARGAVRDGPPVPPDAARAAAASKRGLMSSLSPKGRQQLQLREKLRKQEAQSAAEMTLATAGIALSEGRHAEALELFVRAGHEDRATQALGGAPWIGQMRALMALGRFEPALALLPELQRRTKAQSQERALAHWLAGQAAERLLRLEEAKANYRMAARSHASLRPQAMEAFARVQAQAQAQAKTGPLPAEHPPASSAPPASPASDGATP